MITDMEVRGEAQGAFDHLALRDMPWRRSEFSKVPLMAISATDGVAKRSCRIFCTNCDQPAKCRTGFA